MAAFGDENSGPRDLELNTKLDGGVPDPDSVIGSLPKRDRILMDGIAKVPTGHWLQPLAIVSPRPI
jgi:hypothetical protein